jgi:hypothetical protein
MSVIGSVEACGVIRSRVCAASRSRRRSSALPASMATGCSPSDPKGFPYLTGREQQEMVLYRSRFRHPDGYGGSKSRHPADGCSCPREPCWCLWGRFDRGNGPAGRRHHS